MTTNHVIRHLPEEIKYLVRIDTGEDTQLIYRFMKNANGALE